jgi:hypothetical protein
MQPPDKTADCAVHVAKRGYSYSQAIAYLGIKRRAFERHIRPRLPPPTPCGTSRVFERADLDRAWEDYREAQRVGKGASPARWP